MPMSSLPVRRLVAFVSVAGFAAAGLVAVAVPAAEAAPEVVPFAYTGAAQTWTVPEGVCAVTITAFGASGASAVSQGQFPSVTGLGGVGGSAVGTIEVTPGENLEIRVGGQAQGVTGGFNGGGAGRQELALGATGGGGGASDLRRGGSALADRVLVAGGGGGGAGAGSIDNTASISAGSGGPGGGLSGSPGGNGAYGGGGGTPAAGGAAGTGGAGGPGSADSGGTGGAVNVLVSAGFGGGGGGGWFGGGGGGAAASVSASNGGGGGGGSGYGPAGTTFGVASGPGNGSVTITYDPAITVCTRTYTYTGAPERFVVPAGVCAVTVDATGGKGGDDGGAGAAGRCV